MRALTVYARSPGKSSLPGYSYAPAYQHQALSSQRRRRDNSVGVRAEPPHDPLPRTSSVPTRPKAPPAAGDAGSVCRCPVQPSLRHKMDAQTTSIPRRPQASPPPPL
ncbi:hypothetical protein SKAU_G00204280 [Synaphobranchus kaupii]|uniref:Uncharacterized protein n=1 Tax=Synaphobranchus kaupii TaxID=118154 RepID=A0A9Q1FG36_SYNKA|nr:hypothetical protein SKAU_G00204280 [Synaphobranchus kaupii]